VNDPLEKDCDPLGNEGDPLGNSEDITNKPNKSKCSNVNVTDSGLISTVPEDDVQGKCISYVSTGDGKMAHIYFTQTLTRCIHIRCFYGVVIMQCDCCFSSGPQLSYNFLVTQCS
jgi:hypothetical protein